MKILGVIPARYASTRFPAKALADIDGQTMVRRVYGQAQKSKALAGVVVATDHQRIYDHVAGFGGQVCMTGTQHRSGTDRCQEALAKTGAQYDYVVNIQGDEPFIDPAQIDLLASCLDGHTQLATLAKPITTPQALADPNVVKVIADKNQEAIYFSRSPLPHLREVPMAQWLGKHPYFKHIGIYAYRADTLAQIAAMAPTPLEKAESLEQLRWLENGLPIKVLATELDSEGIDTPEDLARVLKKINPDA